jgi:hypothetical protein
VAAEEPKTLPRINADERGLFDFQFCNSPNATREAVVEIPISRSDILSHFTAFVQATLPKTVIINQAARYPRAVPLIEPRE